MDTKEQGQTCECGGEIDKLYPLEPHVYQGRCFQCGKEYTVVS